MRIDDDIADDGSLEVEWYPIPEWLAEEPPKKLQQARRLRQAGKYCDAEGHCFDTPQGLGGHISATGHHVRAKDVGVRPVKKKTKVQTKEIFLPGDPLHDPNAPWRNTVQIATEIPTKLNWSYSREDALKYIESEFSPEKLKSYVAKREKEIHERLDRTNVRTSADMDELFDAFQNQVSMRDDSFAAWSSSADATRTAPIWHYASTVYKNPNVIPEIAEAVRMDHATDMKVVAEFAAKTQALTRAVDPTYDADSDTVVLYRGVKDVLAQKLKEARDAAEEDELIRIEHRAVESWTTNPNFASNWGAIVLTARVPVSSIIATATSTRLHSGHEAEYIVGTPYGEAFYRKENILPVGYDDKTRNNYIEASRQHEEAWLKRFKMDLGTIGEINKVRDEMLKDWNVTHPSQVSNEYLKQQPLFENLDLDKKEDFETFMDLKDEMFAHATKKLTEEAKLAEESQWTKSYSVADQLKAFTTSKIDLDGFNNDLAQFRLDIQNGEYGETEAWRRLSQKHLSNVPIDKKLAIKQYVHEHLKSSEETAGSVFSSHENVLASLHKKYSEKKVTNALSQFEDEPGFMEKVDALAEEVASGKKSEDSAWLETLNLYPHEEDELGSTNFSVLHDYLKAKAAKK